MAITPAHIRGTITAYLAAHPDEQPGLQPAIDLLDGGADLARRSEFQGHVTAGAVVLNPAGNVLFIHHLGLGRWLMPGGHVEAGDTTLVRAALRELAEETGIGAEQVAAASDEPVDIDIHPIPASAAKGEPAHRHIDFRFLFRTASQVGTLQAAEVTDAAWRGVAAIEDRRLRERVTRAQLPG
jgi:8-oxo-dGTP pyrophosphatase MutT (NUDIX family)